LPEIKPFKACRAIPQYVERFSASAYDPTVQNEDFSGQTSGEYSYLRIMKPENFSDHTLQPEEIFEISRKKLKEIKEQGILIQDDKDSLYVYRQIKDNHTFTGIIGLINISEYTEGHIKKHEKTRATREHEIADYFDKVRLSGSPVLLTYKDEPEIDLMILDIVEPAPVYHFITKARTEHMLWKVEDKGRIDLINSRLKNIPDFYIADGHHRCAGYSVISDGAPKGFMGCLIPASQLYIQSFFRLVKDLNGMSKSEFIDKLSRIFEIRTIDYDCVPASPGVIHLIMKGKCYSLTIPENHKNSNDLKAGLDVSILENLVIKNILNIADTRTSDRIQFLSGTEKPEKIQNMLNDGKFKAAFALYPLSMEVIMEISDIGETMPPKSTWIEPKLRSGLVIHSF
jgi:uncharacterized protein (DUF1015 family)